MSHTLDRPRLLLLAGALALAAATFAIATVRGATHAVAIADFAFAPATLTIAAGDTVTWTNEDAMIHTATSVNGAFDSGDLEEGESYSLTFTTPGTYDYLCTPHPTMTGRIVVVAAAATAAPTTAPATGGGLPNVAIASADDGRPLVLAGALLLGTAALAWPILRGARGRSAELRARRAEDDPARSTPRSRRDE
jgi:amicyanin